MLPVNLMNHAMIIDNERSISYSATVLNYFDWVNDDCLQFRSGREAIISLIDNLALCEGDCVLIPEFVPEGVYDPFVRKQIVVIKYKLNRALEPDWDCFMRCLLLHKPRLAVIIHFFGIKQDVERFSIMCKRHNTIVLEDMAHLARVNEGARKYYSDFVLFSLTKMYGLPDGAILKFNNNLPIDNFIYTKSINSFLYTLSQALILFFTHLSHKDLFKGLFRHVSIVLIVLLQPYKQLMRYYYKCPSKISALSSYMLRRIDVPKIICNRRKKESLYASKLDSNFFKSMKIGDSTEISCGFGYPVIFETEMIRDDFAAYLTSKGIHGNIFQNRWNFFDKQSNLTSGEIVMRTHFIFPTADHISFADICRIIDISNDWANRYNS